MDLIDIKAIDLTVQLSKASGNLRVCVCVCVGIYVSVLSQTYISLHGVCWWGQGGINLERKKKELQHSSSIQVSMRSLGS